MKMELKQKYSSLDQNQLLDALDVFNAKKLGFCEKFKNDNVNEFIRLVNEKNFDGYVFGTPVYYAGAIGSITSFMNRAFIASFQGKSAGKPGAAVINARRGGCSDTLDTINRFFTVSSMPVVGSQYWNETHVQKYDREGMLTMRTL